MKSKLRLKKSGSVTLTLTPHFANTMLGDRPFLIFVYGNWIFIFVN